MAVYTDIGVGELRAFLAPYGLGELLSYRGIAEGVENSNFLVHCEKGNFILTLYEKRVNAADLPFFLGLMEHLAQKGFACPQPVKRADGTVLGELAGRPAAMVTFLEGVWMRRPTVQHCGQLGQGIAALHQAAEGFELTRANSLALRNWRPLWEQCLTAHPGIDNALVDETESLLTYLESHWPTGLPSGVIHADAFPDNVFFIGDELSGVIDFYFACNDALAYDVAVCLNAWCFEADASFNLTKGQALLTHYNSARNFTQAERQALPLLAAGAALRFMLTRLYDWVTTPDGSLVVKKDPQEYIRKMRFHRQVTSVRDYGLDV